MHALIVEASSCRKAARHQRHRAAQVVRQLARSNERRCRSALAIWADHVARNRALRARLCTAVHRLALLRLAAAFTSWACFAETKRLRCMHLEGLLQRVWLMSTCAFLDSILSSIRACTWILMACLGGAHSYEDMQCSGTQVSRNDHYCLPLLISRPKCICVGSAVSFMVLQALAKAQQRALQAAFFAWTEAAAASAERQRFGEMMAARQRHSHMRSVFRAWQQEARELQRIRQLLAKAVHACAARAMSIFFSNWRRAVRESRWVMRRHGRELSA